MRGSRRGRRRVRCAFFARHWSSCGAARTRDQAPVPAALEGASNRPDPAGTAALVAARLVGPAPQVEVASQYAAYWYARCSSESSGVELVKRKIADG